MDHASTGVRADNRRLEASAQAAPPAETAGRQGQLTEPTSLPACDRTACQCTISAATITLRSLSVRPVDWQNLETFSFGDSPALADELAALVLAGIKTATCWTAVDGLKTEPGKLMVMLDGNGRPLAIIETVELTLRRFDEVDASFAYDEGEGDRTFPSWREAHRRYFSRLDQFSPDMMVYCERFRIVERL